MSEMSPRAADRLLEILAEGLRRKHPGAVVEIVDDRDDEPAEDLPGETSET